MSDLHPSSPEPAASVEWFMGVDGPGEVLCGPHLPYSMVRLGPDTIRPHKTTGYSSGLPLQRFSHTHVSGTGGSGRYGNIGVTPFIGLPRLNVGPYERAEERAEPGYYSVCLMPDRILAELTVTPRVGCHRYTFPTGERANVSIDAGACIQAGLRAAAVSTGGFVEWVSPSEVAGRGDFRGGWGHDFPYSVYFVAQFSRPAEQRWVAAGTRGVIPGPAADGPGCQVVAGFGAGEPLELRVGISFVSLSKARASLRRETDGRSFDAIRAQARQVWNAALGRIQVQGGTETERTLFYTSMARLLALPTDLGVDDENPLWQSGVRHYWDFYCLWDSVRNANSLLTLFDPEREVSLLSCLLDIAEHTGWLPDAWIAGHHGFRQGGSPADVLFCEAFLKGLTGIDYPRALAAMRRNNEVESPDPLLYGRYLAHYRDHGYVPTGVNNCVSRHIEYAYQDWCIGRLADGLGQSEIAHRYYRDAGRLWNLWNDRLGFFAPRDPQGNWAQPFNPLRTERADSWNDPYFYEGPSVGWSLNTQHDFAGLIARRGGPQSFCENLDQLLASGFHVTKETFMHLPFLFVYAGRPDRTQHWSWTIAQRTYSAARNGLPDNEDMGSQSAFYMGCAMGLYPIMGQDLYILTTPFFERTVVDLGTSGRQLVIEAPGSAPDRRYIVGATLNGVPLYRAWLRHGEIANGATLCLEMGAEPSTWGRAEPPPAPRPFGKNPDVPVSGRAATARSVRNRHVERYCPQIPKEE